MLNNFNKHDKMFSNYRVFAWCTITVMRRFLGIPQVALKIGPVACNEVEGDSREEAAKVHTSSFLRKVK